MLSRAQDEVSFLCCEDKLLMLLNLLFTWALYLHLPSCLPAAWTTAYAVEWSPDVGPKKKITELFRLEKTFKTTECNH